MTIYSAAYACMQAEIAELEGLLDDLLPQDHGLYSRCARTVRELCANPSYSHEQRCALLRRQVRGQHAGPHRGWSGIRELVGCQVSCMCGIPSLQNRQH